jgi:UPF0716 family protein affecting phage T7 exclusion
LSLLFFAASLMIAAAGALMVHSGFEGFQWLQHHHLGGVIPSPETFNGIGIGLLVTGVLIFLAGLVEHFICPSCPFTLTRSWDSPTLRKTPSKNL